MKYCRTSQGARGVSPAALIAGCAQAQAQTESDLAGPGGAVKLVGATSPTTGRPVQGS